MSRVGLLTLSLVAALTSATRGAELSLLTEPAFGSIITATPGGVVSPVVVRAAAESVVSDPEEFLAGWQLTLSVVPVGDTRGSVQLAGASEPQSDYVFEGLSSLGVSVFPSGSSLVAFDALFPLNGGAEPTVGAGAALLSVETTASADAAGTFQLVALAGRGASEWTDSNETAPMRREFANLLDSGEPLVLAEIVIPLAGDYNDDGTVDAADYTVWRDNVGSPAGTLPNDPLDEQVGDAQYQQWRAHYGESLTGDAASAAETPEPNTAMLAVGIVSAAFAFCRH